MDLIPPGLGDEREQARKAFLKFFCNRCPLKNRQPLFNAQYTVTCEADPLGSTYGTSVGSLPDLLADTDYFFRQAECRTLIRTS